QNYNIDFLLMHLHDTLYIMKDYDTAWFEILRQLRVLFITLVEGLSGMTGIIANIDTPIDSEAYNNIHEDLNCKFPFNYWYKEWRYLYSIYQAFVEWSAVPINKDLIDQGELMIIKDLWKFGDQEWTKAATKSEAEMNGFKYRLKNSLNHI